jgi:hypothetical protein
MKNKVQNKSSGFFRGLLTVMALAALFVTALPLSAQAALQGSAGNTQIWNRVTVSYSNGAGVAQTPVVSNVAVVTVNTVNVAPTIRSYNPASGSTDGTGATQAYAVSIMTNSNGPGTITLAAADGSPTNMTVSGTTPTITGSLFLGATVFDPTASQIGSATTVAATTSITVAIPNDHGIPTATATTGGAFNDGVINGLAVNDIVYISNGIGGTWGPFTVTAVTDPVEGSATTAAPGSITLRNNTGAAIGPFTPAVSWQIVEAKDATLTVTQGVVTTPTSAAQWVTTVTAAMGAQSSNTPTVITIAHSSSLTVTKYVRNVTAAVVGATSITAPAGIGGATYYQTGVTGKPTDVLEYLLVIANPGLGSATVVVATDPVPIYTTLLSSSTTYGANNLGSTTTGLFAQALRGALLQAFHIDDSTGIATVGWGKSSGVVGGSTMTFYLGNGSSSIAGGAILSLETDYVVYQVTIN